MHASYHLDWDLAGAARIGREVLRQGDAVLRDALHVFGWSRSRKRYTLHCFDSSGRQRPPALGTWNGERLLLEGRTLAGARFVELHIDDGALIVATKASAAGAMLAIRCYRRFGQ